MVVEVFRPAFPLARALVRRIQGRPLVARLLFWPLALLLLISAPLQFGAWRAEFNFAGPFAAESNPPRAALMLQVPRSEAPWWSEPLVGDDNAKPLQSLLELRINGREMGPPHTQHELIRRGITTGFSHWGPDVFFSLPPGVQNGPETIVTLQYVIRPRTWIIFALPILGLLLGWLAYSDTLKWLAARRLTAFVLKLPYLILAGLCLAGVAAAAVFVASSLSALAAGWALPTTALIHRLPIAEWAARNEPYFGYLLLMLAGAGTVATWLMSSSVLHRPVVTSIEQSTRTLLAWCGFPIVASAYFLSISAMWAGIVRPGDLNAMNLAGLVPLSDANDYLAAAFDQVRGGAWNAVALHRPLAAGFRSVLLIFSNFSLPSMLILQAALVAAATCFATWAIVVWRGVWAGTAFFALAYIYASVFVQTTLTEALALFWALVSIPFFVKSFRDRSASAALVAFAMTTAALMTRMGSMFTIPALLVWLVWYFANGIAARLRIAVAAIAILLGVFGLNVLLLKTYGTGHSSLGSNFSYVICGLTIGTGWEGCPAKLANEGKPLPDNEAASTAQLYSMAWTSFRARPEVFFSRVADNLATFVSDFPNVIWHGYLKALGEPEWLFRNTLTTICLAGLAYSIARRAQSVEMAFWALVWASIAASASLIYPDDGPRTLAASQPLIAMFFAMGMRSPALIPATGCSPSRLSRYGWIGLAVAALLFLCVPWMTHRFFEGASVDAMPQDKKDEALVFGGRRMSGLLVVADDKPLRNDIPSFHMSNFEGIVRQSNIEIYQDLIHPVAPSLPFALVFAPRLEKDRRSNPLYIVPPEVIERRDVPAWHFHLERWGYRPGGYGEYWVRVTKAQPWP